MMTVVFDFDGVLAEYHGWVSEEHTGPPVPGAKEFVADLLREGFDVAVHTTRRADVVMEWCGRWGFIVPKMWPGSFRICREKPKALLYVDDHGFRFTGPGSWEEVKKAISQKPWWQKETV